MEINADRIIEDALRHGVRDAVKQKFSSSYNNPADKVIESAFAAHSSALQKLIDEGIASCLNDEEFRSEIICACRTSLAKVLVQRFGGELEKQVNALKSNPATRARITLAIEEIVASAGN